MGAISLNRNVNSSHMLIRSFIAEHLVDFKFYDVMLLAFVKCNKAWVESWFPNKDELDKLNVLKPLSGDHTYFLRYEEEGNKRLAVDVSSNWVKDTFFAQGWQIDMDVSPW